MKEASNPTKETEPTIKGPSITTRTSETTATTKGISMICFV